MSADYSGLTKNSWPGTWAPGSNAPIAVDTDLRGTLQSISGSTGDQLTNIPGQRLTEGMLVYVKNGYTSGATTRTGDKYYKYTLLGGQVRDPSTGSMPNAEANWVEFAVSGGGGGIVGDYVETVTAGTGVTITGGTGPASTATVSIGQAIAPTDTVTFQNVVIAAGGTLTFTDDIARALANGATGQYAQVSAASRMYTNADAANGLSISDLKPGDFYYDDSSASIYICYDTGAGYYDILDLTVRA